jgi:hypothetical protein
MRPPGGRDAPSGQHEVERALRPTLRAISAL